MQVTRVEVFVYELLIFNDLFLGKMMDEFFDAQLDDQESEEGWGAELPFNSIGNTHLNMEGNVEVQYQESAEVSTPCPQCKKDSKLIIRLI